MGEIALRFLCYCRADVDDTPPSGRAHVRNDGTSQRREGYGEDLKDTPEVLIGKVEEISSGEVIGLRHYDFGRRSEEHTSELQSLMRISYAVFCLKKKTQ